MHANVSGTVNISGQEMIFFQQEGYFTNKEISC